MPSRRPSPWVLIVGIVLILAVAYPLSIGPVSWMVGRGWVKPKKAAVVFIPILRVTVGKPTWIQSLIDEYVRLWSFEGYNQMTIVAVQDELVHP